MHLELEGKLGPQPQLQPCTSILSHDKNSLPEKNPAQEGREEKESQSTSEEKV